MIKVTSSKRPNNDGKWPIGDGKDGWEGFDEAKGL